MALALTLTEGHLSYTSGHRTNYPNRTVALESAVTISVS